MIPASGGEAVQYIGEKGGSSFRFSPDGKYLAFKRTVDKTSQVFIMNLNGGEAVQLTHHTNSIDSYKWSSDAGRIFFTADEPMGEEEQKEYDLGDGRYWIDWIDRVYWRDDNLFPHPAFGIRVGVWLAPLSENRGSHPHHRGPLGDGDLEIVAHAHGKMGERHGEPGFEVVAELTQCLEVRA